MQPRRLAEILLISVDPHSLLQSLTLQSSSHNSIHLSNLTYHVFRATTWTTKTERAPNLAAAALPLNPLPTRTVASDYANLLSKPLTSTKIPTSSKTMSARSSADYVSQSTRTMAATSPIRKDESTRQTWRGERRGSRKKRRKMDRWV